MFSDHRMCSLIIQRVRAAVPTFFDEADRTWLPLYQSARGEDGGVTVTGGVCVAMCVTGALLPYDMSLCRMRGLFYGRSGGGVCVAMCVTRSLLPYHRSLLTLVLACRGAHELAW